MLDDISDMIRNKIAEPSCKLQVMQKDLRLAINMSDNVDQPLHVSSAVNEVCMILNASSEKKKYFLTSLYIFY